MWQAWSAGTGTTADGTWFAVDGEGQTGNRSNDRLHGVYWYHNATNHELKVYSAGTAGQRPAACRIPITDQRFLRVTNCACFPDFHFANQTGQLAAGSHRLSSGALCYSQDRQRKSNGSLMEPRIASMTNANIDPETTFVGYWNVFILCSAQPQTSFRFD